MMTLPAQLKQLDPEGLLHGLAGIQLIPESDISRILSRFRSVWGESASCQELATDLVQSHILTDFQANLALQGQVHRLQLGPYHLQDISPTTGFGTSYKAVHRTERTIVTLATLPLRNLWNVQQAKKHLVAIQELPRHSTIVPLLDLATANGCHYFVWPEIIGESFETLVRRAGSLPPAHAGRFMMDVADGLSVCHRGQVFHGTLSPANLVLGPDRKPRILDLGLGIVLFDNLSDQDSMIDTLSMTRLVSTTLECLAPELIAEQSLPSAESDVYSFGSVLYFLVTGTLPFPAESSREVISARMTRQFQSARELNGAVPVPLSQLLDELLDRDSHRRPNDLAEVRDRLGRIVEGRDSVAITAAVPALTKSQFRRDLAASADTPTGTTTKTVTVKKPPLSLSEINFDLPVAVSPEEQNSFEMAVSGAFPLPGLEEVESIDEALIRAATLADELKQAQQLQDQDEPRTKRKSLLSKTAPEPRLDAIPDPVAWVSNKKSDMDLEANSGRLGLSPKPVEGFWARALKLLKFWGPPTDLVQVSLFGPPTITPGQPVKLMVYAHLPDDFHNIKTISRAMQDQVELLAVGNPDRMIPRGSELGMHLSVANGGVAKSVFRFPWEGKPKSFNFEVLITWESPPGRSPAVLSIGVDNVLTARIPFAVTIKARAGA